MSKISYLYPIIFLAALLTISFTISQKAAAAEIITEKKAILVVSFGTTHADTRKVTIEAVENKIRENFPNHEVRRAFTSRIIIKRLAERDGLKIDNEREALAKLQAEGYREVIVQPLHIVGGEEYEKVKAAVEDFKKTSAFAKISLGRPILYYMGQEERPDDYELAINAVSGQFPKLKSNEAVVFLGHGGVHPANAAYAALELRLRDLGFKNIYIATVDSYPSIGNVVEKLKAAKIKKATLMPFLLVAGDHAKNDLAGDEEGSLKSILKNAGFTVETYIRGLGENPAIQDIYVQHVRDTIDNTDKMEDEK